MYSLHWLCKDVIVLLVSRILLNDSDEYQSTQMNTVLSIDLLL